MDEAEKAIYQELFNLYPSTDIQKVFLALGLKKTEQPAHFELIRGWHRSGGETYAAYFSLSSSEFELPRTYVLKACCPSCFSDVTKVLDKWLLKREFMRSSGINTPELYAKGQGVILEEFIPYSIEEAARINSYSANYFSMIADFYKAVGALGFLPISLYHNIRSRGKDVVNIDFGGDLGARNDTPQCLDQLLEREQGLMGFPAPFSQKPI